MENFKYAVLNKNDLKKSIMCIVLISSFLFFIAIFVYFALSIRPVSQVRDIKQIEIRSGEGFRQIAVNLESAKIIRSSVAFQTLSIIFGSAHKLKPGVYDIDLSLSAPNILRQVIAGPDIERGVVIPEGLTFLDIDKRLSDAGIIKSGALANFNFEILKNDYDFLKELKSPIKIEGYLFPDTYNFFINSKPEDVVRKFLDNFNAKAWPILNGQKRIAGKVSLGSNQLLNIASLIEKEVYFSEDKLIVSGIIYKRLKIGMALQLDATIVYAKCKGLIFYCDDAIFYRKDTNFISPYNTYLHNGLTPTPISNPGLDSINAALNPTSTDYLYYLSDPKTHKLIFSKTFEEHNQNRKLYLGV
jgi:UPF0755 protein